MGDFVGEVMTQTFYAQGDRPEKTMTVAELVEKLLIMDQSMPVTFKSPMFGSFDSNTAYTIDDVQTVTLPRREHHIPAGEHIDDETGDTYATEEETQVWNEWTGVVIT